MSLLIQLGLFKEICTCRMEGEERGPTEGLVKGKEPMKEPNQRYRGDQFEPMFEHS